MSKSLKLDSLIIQFQESIEYIENAKVKQKLMEVFEDEVFRLDIEDFEYIYCENIAGGINETDRL